MTVNQISYWTLQETKRSNAAKEKETERSNKAKEAETYRSNLARETEDHRANLAKELELNRSNLAREAEEHRSNVADETERFRSNFATETEQQRSNLAKEAIERGKLAELKRANKKGESLKGESIDISAIQADAAKEQAAASTSRAEQAWWGDWSKYIKSAETASDLLFPKSSFDLGSLTKSKGERMYDQLIEMQEQDKNASLAGVIPESITFDKDTGEVSGVVWKDGKQYYKQGNSLVPIS